MKRLFASPYIMSVDLSNGPDMTSSVYIGTRCTEMLLRVLSSHLSSRVECRKVSYQLTIYSDGKVQFTPEIKVFPDRYHRKAVYKLNVLEHVLTYHCLRAYAGKDEQGAPLVDTTVVIPGVYQYQSSVDGKRRKWIRVK